jgi:chaperonin GroES
MSEVTNTSGIAPLGCAILVKPYVTEEKTSGGIILPEAVRQKDALAEQKAIVIEVGPTAWADEPKPRAVPGDRILFSKWAGYLAIGPADDQQYRLINDSDVFAGITKEKANGS